MTRTLFFVTTILSLALVSGCKKPKAPTEPPPLCSLRLPEHLAHTKPDELPAPTWFQLLFKGYADGVPRDPVDCSGEPIAWPELPDGCIDREPEAKLLGARPLEATDLAVRHAGGEYWFGWAVFRQYDNGLAEGPLAIARVHEGRLEARAIGTLRAYTTRARLEVRKIGGEHLLNAEGERCDAAGECVRASRLMLLDHQRFRARPVRSASVRTCLGPAWFPFVETRTRALDKRWQRELQRNQALAFEEDVISVDEHILVNDRDTSQPSLPARLFREAQSKIKIRVADGELLAEGQSLWQSIQVEDGSTEAEAQAADAPQGAPHEEEETSHGRRRK